MSFLPISVIILTKNEEARISETLRALKSFDDIWVVDSHSEDNTAQLSREQGAQVIEFAWNGLYPKKKQWAVDNIELKHDWVLLLDADERLTQDICQELRRLFKSYEPECDGYFVKGVYRINDKILGFGMQNSKLSLFRRNKFAFPEIQDIGFDGGWEVEGHYQPVSVDKMSKIGCLKSILIHDAFDNEAALDKRHENYASWEALMTIHKAWPEDPVWFRQQLKKIFRVLPFRGTVMFIYCYFFKMGLLDGGLGYKFARQRMGYYNLIAQKMKEYKNARTS